MLKYYTRPCNFYHGKQARILIKKKKALALAGNKNIAFDQIEVFTRKNNNKSYSKFYFISEVNKLKKNTLIQVRKDLKKITKKRLNISKIKFDEPKIMGILNITPDSFSDGGMFVKKSEAFKQVNLMIKSGARIIDVGGESTKPGSKPVNKVNEWKRIKYIINKIKINFPKTVLSLDTRKSYIMNKGIDNGVDIINDVSGLNFDKRSIDIIVSKKIPLVLHHMQGIPENMQKKPKYDDVLLDIYDFFEDKIKQVRKKGIKHNNIIIDPGIGFGKNLKHNITLISNVSLFHSLGFPIMLGISRKKFIKELSGNNDSKERLGGTIGAALYGMMQGVQIFRIHDVNEVNQSIKVFNSFYLK